MRWVRGDVCVWCGRRKKKGPGTWVVGKKREIKGKKKWGVGFTCIVGKKREWKKRRKKFEKEKTKLVLFVCSPCLVQNVEL